MTSRETLLFPPQVAAPDLNTTQWFNNGQSLSLAGLRGKVVVLHAFQMLCPGCVSHGIPQAQRIHETFDSADVAVIGLHTVFEHHMAMQPVSLAAFLHEYRVSFPVGVDAPGGEDGIPRTMRAYDMRGTPTIILIDRNGFLRYHGFGQVPDLAVGAVIAQLTGEK
jgi:peroxiredoxin